MKILALDPGWDHTPYLVAELAKAGIEVVLATTLPEERYFLQRYCKQLPAPWAAGSHDFYARLLRDQQADLVLPLSEEIMEVIWQLPENLTQRVFPQTTPLQRTLLGDRTQMYAFIEAQGVPIPRMMALGDRDEVPAALEALGSPMVLRGTQGLAGLQVMIVRDVHEAQRAYDDLVPRSPGPPFAQAFAMGRRCLIGGLFDRGQALQLFSQTTVESLRPPTGPSIRVRSLRDPKLERYAERIFAALEWDGLACAEFIQDSQGDYRFLEINPRPWAAIYAAHNCGVPLLRTFAAYLRGERAPRRIEFPDGKEVVLFPQFISARLAAGEFGRLRDVGSYLRSLRGAPWSRPMLVLHMLRRAMWSRRDPESAEETPPTDELAAPCERVNEPS